MTNLLVLASTNAEQANFDFVELMYKGFVGKILSGETGLSVVAGILITAGVFISLLIIAYLLGSLNFGIIISKHFYHDDVRNYGSNNAGTTNMLRTYGTKAAVFTLIGDLLKGLISVLIARFVFGVYAAYYAGLFCIIGHAFPIYYKFKGGKGVAAAAGVILGLDWRIFLICVAIFAILVIGSKYVSLGSIISAMVFPILVDRFDVGLTPGLCKIAAIIIGLFIVFLHRANLKRLFSGQESKISFKKNKKEE